VRGTGWRPGQRVRVAGVLMRGTHPAHSTGEEPDIAARARWLVVCSCGWERECSSEWAAQSACKLHPQLGPMDVEHVTRVEGQDDSVGDQQLTLT
jgi:hypothetical protein